MQEIHAGPIPRVSTTLKDRLLAVTAVTIIWAAGKQAPPPKWDSQENGGNDEDNWAASAQIGKRGPAHAMTGRIWAAELLYGFAD